MPITYTKFIHLLKARRISFYRLKKSAHIAEATLDRLRHNRSVSMRTIDRICEVLEWQPGDLMEFVEGQEDDELPLPARAQTANQAGRRPSKRR